MADNICKFINSSESDTEITTINFIYEKNWNLTTPFFRSSFVLCIVAAGEGRLISQGKEYRLQKGDVFFLFCAREYLLLNENGLEYLYISFMGSRVHPLFERLHISLDRGKYPGFESLIPFWIRSIERAETANGDLVAQAVLYYTFSYMAEERNETAAKDAVYNPILEIKRYLDTNFSDPSISLRSVAARFGYNPKYVSDKFTTTVFVPLSVYLAERRIQYAKTLLEKGQYTVSQVAQQCGYNDAMYFSKVFKKHVGCSPLAYRRTKAGTAENAE